MTSEEEKKLHERVKLACDESFRISHTQRLSV